MCFYNSCVYAKIVNTGQNVLSLFQFLMLQYARVNLKAAQKDSVYYYDSLFVSKTNVCCTKCSISSELASMLTKLTATKS